MTDAMDAWRARRQHERDRRRRTITGPGNLTGARNRKVRGQPCRICGTHQSIEAHHILPRSYLGRTHPHLHHDDNLMPLCHLHHQHHHTGGRAARIPRHHLTPAELAFATQHARPGWLDTWYPPTPPLP